MTVYRSLITMTTNEYRILFNTNRASTSKKDLNSPFNS